MANPAAAPRVGIRSSSTGPACSSSQHNTQPCSCEQNPSQSAAESPPVDPRQSPVAAHSLHQRSGHLALASLTAALKATGVEADAPPAVAAICSVSSRQQQAAPGRACRGSPPRQEAVAATGAHRLLSTEAAAAASGQADRPRSGLGSGGLSGDPVLLESFLSAGLRASSTEVSAVTRRP